MVQKKKKNIEKHLLKNRLKKDILNVIQFRRFLIIITETTPATPIRMTRLYPGIIGPPPGAGGSTDGISIV